MKYLIVGLGNMGSEYDQTRHNIGFEILDSLAWELDVKFKNENLGDVAVGKHKGRTLILLKPSTYVNRSGKAVRFWGQKHKIKKDNLLVVVDDLNLDFGKQRLRLKGKDGGHNGLKDIQDTLGTNAYARLRVGIGSNFARGRQVDFVLGQWTNEEGVALPDILTESRKQIKQFVQLGTEGIKRMRN